MDGEHLSCRLLQRAMSKWLYWICAPVSDRFSSPYILGEYSRTSLFSRAAELPTNLMGVGTLLSKVTRVSTVLLYGSSSG